MSLLQPDETQGDQNYPGLWYVLIDHFVLISIAILLSMRHAAAKAETLHALAPMPGK